MAGHKEPDLDPMSDGTSASRNVGRRIWSAGVVVVAVALIASGAVYAFTRQSTEKRTPPTPRALPSAHLPPCGLRVVESAVTRRNHYRDGRRDPLNDLFLVSAIVENPCKRTATNAPFIVSPLDSRGRELLSAGKPVQDNFTIDLIMPGQRAAGWTSFTRKDAPGGIAKLKVQRNTRSFGPICWIDPAASGYRTTVRATDITVGKRDNSPSLLNGGVDLSFSVTWSPKNLPLRSHAASVIFRDSSGRLLNVNGQSIGTAKKTGQREHFEAWAPPHIDRTRTEVLLEPDPATHGLPYKPKAPCLATSS